MEEAYGHAKQAVVNYKLERCCCAVPIRVGVFIIGYFNLFISVISLLGTAEGGIKPPLMEVQELILEDFISQSWGIFAYSAELAFSMLLLCAMYRNDIVLLRKYMWLTVAQTLTQLVIYSALMVRISLLTKIFIFLNIIYNGYIILIVRSAIVEIRKTRRNVKNGHVVLYSSSKIQEPPVDIEAAKLNVIERVKILEKIEIEDKKDKPKIEDKKNLVPMIEDKKDEVPTIEDKKDKVLKIEDKEEKVIKTEDKEDKASTIEDKVIRTGDKKDKVPKTEDKKDKITKIENLKNKVLKIERKRYKVPKIESKKEEMLQVEDKKDEEKTKLDTVTEKPKE